MTQVTQTWSLSRFRVRNICISCFICISKWFWETWLLWHIIYTYCSYTRLTDTIRGRKLILKIQTLQSNYSINVFSASSSLSLCSSGCFPVLEQLSPQHNPSLTASQTKPQMNCRCTAETSLCPAHRKCKEKLYRTIFTSNNVPEVFFKLSKGDPAIRMRIFVATAVSCIDTVKLYGSYDIDQILCCVLRICFLAFTTLIQSEGNMHNCIIFCKIPYPQIQMHYTIKHESNL